MAQGRAHQRIRFGRWRALGVLALLAASVLPAHAAELVPMLAESVQVRRDRASDLVWGQNNKGPYTLSRRMLISGSETVYINGAHAFRLADYQIDYTAGTIAFQDPLPGGQVARVEYAFDPKKSSANIQPLKAPLSLDLAELQLGPLMKTTLQFNGVWTTPAQGAPTLSAVGMGMNTNLGANTRVSSLIAITPSAARTDNPGTDLDASAVQLAAQTKLQGLQAKVNYVRTGRAFAAAKEYNWKKGTQLFDLSTAYTFNKYLTARTSLQRTDEFTPDGTIGRTTTAVANEVSAQVTGSSRVTMAHNAREVAVPNQQAQSTITDRVQLDQRLGQTATAQLRHEVVTTGTGENAKPVATTGVKVGANVVSGARITAEHVEVKAEDQDAVAMTNVKLDANVTAGTHLTAQRSETRTQDQDPTVNTQVGVSAKAPGGLKLEGQYAQQQGPGLAPLETRTARLEAAPVGGLKLTGGVAQKQTGDIAQTQKNAAVEINTYAGLRLVGQLYSQVDGNGNSLGITRSVDARLKPLQSVEISGTYKEREQGSQSGPLTRGLQVSLSPVKFFQLSGSLVQNPETQGAITEEERRAVKLRSDMGPLSLAGSYAQRLTSASEALAEEMEVSLALQISKYDRLFSAYKLAEQMGANALSTTHYRVGYTRSFGDTFGLSLEGEYLQYMEGDQALQDRNEARAKAGLNARF